MRHFVFGLQDLLEFLHRIAEGLVVVVGNSDLLAGREERVSDPALAANLAIACARAQDFERALSLASELQNIDDPQLRTVCNRIEESARSQAPQLAQGIAPFRPAPATSGLLDSERRREFSLTR